MFPIDVDFDDGGYRTTDIDIRTVALQQAVIDRGGLGRNTLELAGSFESYIRYGRLHDGEGTRVLAPEIFANEDTTIILLNGQEYFRPCGLVVVEAPPYHGRSSYCVKPVGHESKNCEDVAGNINHRVAEA